MVNSILPTVAELQDNTVDSGSFPHERLWKLRYLDETKTAALLAYYNSNFPNEIRIQKANWSRRADEIEANLELVKSGRSVPPRALRLPGGGLSGDTPASLRPTAVSFPSTPVPTSAGSPAPNTRERDEQVHTSRQFIRSVFTSNGVINKELLKERLRQLVRQKGSPIYQLPVEALQTALQQEVTGAVLEGTWMLKSIDPVTDQFRKHIFNAMKETPTFVAKDLEARANELMQREVLETTGQERTGGIPNAIMMKVINELAEFKGGERLWHSKNGLIQFSAVPNTGSF
jgi:hypothetical protein